MARIRNRGGRWTAEVRYKDIVDARTFDLKEHAQRWARDAEREIDLGTYIPTKERKRLQAEEAARPKMPTLSQLMVDYQDTKEHTDKKGHSRESVRLNFLANQEFAKKPANEVTVLDIDSYIDDRIEAEVSGSTIRLDLAAISIIFQHYRRTHGLTNPLRDVRRPSPGKARDRRLQGDEEARLLKAADDDAYPFMRQAIIFAIETAMRRSEMCSLTWKNIDLVKRTAYLPDTKNGNSRTVPLNSRAMSAIKSIPQRIDNGSVFGLHVDRLSDAWDRTRERAKISDLRWHDLRHEATSRLFELTDLRDMEIMMITGHKSPQMLARYTQLRAGHLAERLG